MAPGLACSVFRYSWGSLEYGGRLKLIQYRSKEWFAPVRVECNILEGHILQAAAAEQVEAAPPCKFESNVDYGSSDMKHVKASSPEECCGKCSADDSCAAGVFTANNSQCWIKSKADLKHKIKARPGIATVACIPPDDYPARLHTAPSTLCTFEKDTDFAGDGRDGVPSDSPADCCKKCQADVRCMAATWVPNSCWIKFSRDNPVALPAARNGTACITNKKPAVVPQSIVCTAANDGLTAWSGRVALAIAPLTAHVGAKASWSETIDVGPVPPGEARRFWAQPNGSTACPAGGAPCWLYGGQQQYQQQQQHGGSKDGKGASLRPSALRADIGVPLQSLKSLISGDQLPKAKVSVVVIATNATAAELTVTAAVGHCRRVFFRHLYK